MSVVASMTRGFWATAATAAAGLIISRFFDLTFLLAYGLLPSVAGLVVLQAIMARLLFPKRSWGAVATFALVVALACGFAGFLAALLAGGVLLFAAGGSGWSADSARHLEVAVTEIGSIAILFPLMWPVWRWVRREPEPTSG